MSSPIPVKEGDIQVKVRFDYSKAAKMLNAHPQLFFPNMTPKEAYYAKKKLEILCKCKLESHQAIHPGIQQEGYVFEKI